LKYCTTFACTAYLPNPLVVERLEHFYVEHSIVTAEFQYYYLHYVALTIGPFPAHIVATNGS